MQATFPPPQGQTEEPQSGTTAAEVREQPRRTSGRRWAELGVTALVAAVVASGTTLAVTGNDAQDNTAATASTQTVDPSPSSVGANDWQSVAAKASPAVVAIAVRTQQGEAQGSGVVWDAKGNIVTNNHVVSGLGSGAQIQVRLGAQKDYAATVVGTDPTTDLAVIRLTSPPSGLTPLARASANSLKVGDPVMALGNPLGLSGTVTTGIVSALNRPVTTQVTSSQGSDNQSFSPVPRASSGEVVTDAIQTSAAINPGNSGGALVDASGRLVGINSSIASLSSGGSGSGGSEAGNIGIGFSIPVAEVDNIAGQLIANGSVNHATLGISITDGTVKQGAATVSGAGVQAVVDGSAAAKAGLKKGDLVTAVDDSPIDSADGLVGAVRGLAVGQQVKLTVMDEGGQTRTVTATLAGQK